MLSLNLPPYEARISQVSGKTRIFDEIRRRYVALTSEEWVRQHFVHFLIACKGYPKSLLANEVRLSLNGTIKRCDTLLYRADFTPRMVIEYKAPDVEITQDTFDQITRYNHVLHADYLTVSNGIRHFCCHIDYTAGNYTFLPDIPSYNTL